MKNVKAGHTRPIVCLDAGHYGKYNRSPVVPDLYESDIVWKLHLLLKTELEKYGIEVWTTRKGQAKDLGLESRGKASKGADLFLSLHVNAAANPDAKYALAIPQVDDDCGAIDEQSRELARLLVDSVGQTMGISDCRVWTRESASDRDGNGHKDDYYGVLRGAHSVGTAGVILEHGFYTNKAHATWLMDDGNLRLLAVRTALVLSKWFGVSEAEEPAPKAVPTVAVTLPVLYPGDKNEHVEVMQALLIGYGYSCGKEGVDGSNGPNTQAALKRYQADSELAVDGKCGPATWASLLRQK